jgi:DNA-binding MarR family transcriptional regulator
MDDCNCLTLRQATRSITANYDKALSAVALRSTQLSILYKIAERDAMSINELSAAMVMDRTTLARNLKPLERDTLVEVQPGKDRRERVVTLTPAGKQKLEEALPIWRAAQAEFESRFGTQRSHDLRNTLQDVVVAANTDQAPPA